MTSQKPYSALRGSLRTIVQKNKTAPEKTQSYSFDELVKKIAINGKELILDDEEVLEPFFKFQFGTAPQRSLFFSHNGNIKELSSKTSLYVDSTYKIVENSPFSQLLVLITESMGSVSSFIFFHV